MDDFESYISSAINNQEELVKGLTLALSRHYGFEEELLAALTSPETKMHEKGYNTSIRKRNAALLKTVEGVVPLKWESILEEKSPTSPIHPHPYTEAFNRLAEEKGLPVRLHDNGPKDYCIAKIKSLKIANGDITKIDDINRIMVETNDPETDQKIGNVLVSMRGIKDVHHQENRDMQGFISDVYRMKFDNGVSAEIAFVPYGLVASSSITHNALRFRRASKAITNKKSAKRLYNGICASIKKKFNAASKDLKVDKKYVDDLDLQEFSLAEANKKLGALENECLNAVLNNPVNKKWKSIFRQQ